MNETPTGSTTASTPTMPTAPAVAVESVKIHHAANISDSAFWAAHSVAGIIILLSAVAVFLSQGPRRKDAVAALAQLQQKKPG